MKEYKIIGIDLAKYKFHIAALDGAGKVAFKEKMVRDEVFGIVEKNFAKGSTIAMEACAGCHYFGQEFEKRGYEVKLLKPCDVKPYSAARQKNDMNDAIGICKAGLDPELRLVHIKTKEEQEVAYLHKKRSQVMRQRIAIRNELIAGLAEEGVAPKISNARFVEKAAELIESSNTKGVLPLKIYKQMRLDLEMVKALSEREKDLEEEIKSLNKTCKKASRLLSIPGIGPVNASILSIQSYSSYDTARDFSASLGLVPTQHTTGGVVKLGSITKRGNRYVRTMLVQGARSLLMSTYKKGSGEDKKALPAGDIYEFITRLKERGKPFNLMAIAIANKLARIAYSCLVHEQRYVAAPQGGGDIQGEEADGITAGTQAA